jgi:UDP-N-acetylglucosamine enolpyruvyl transferase
MKDVLLVKGKKELSGTVQISGSKNAALPILGASLLLN